MSAKRNVAILGAGPAGLSAALWLKNLGFEPRVFEADARPGGLQNLNFLANNWVLGQSRQSGPELAARFVAHARDAGIDIRSGQRAAKLSGRAGAFELQLSDGSVLVCTALLVATGTRYRAAEVLAHVTGIAEIPLQTIVYGPYAFADLDACAGKRVLIVGGGDNAFENARLLAQRNAHIVVVARSRPRAQQTLAAAVAASPQCRVIAGTDLRTVISAGGALHVTLAGVDDLLVVDRIHVLAGYEPNTVFLRELLAEDVHAALRFDAQGYLRIDDACRSGVPGIYAAGDVCNPVFPSVVSALAQGAIAAKTIEMDTRPT